jgi:UDP-glucose 4-epimerase
MPHFKCLVTGGAGFIGSHISRRLVELGHEVTCLDNFDDYYDSRIKEDNVRPLLAYSNYHLFRGSILNKEDLGKCVMDVDFIFHNAARPGIRESLKNPVHTHNVNATGTLMVLEAARAANVKKVIYASSSSVYGNVNEFPIRETSRAKPISTYGHPSSVRRTIARYIARYMA